MSIVIAVGDPAGVGPKIAIEAVRQLAGSADFVIVGDARRLSPELAGTSVRVIDAGPVSDAAIEARAPSAEGGAQQLRALDLAMECAKGECRALVTGPVSKLAITMSGTKFVGQTEHLARWAGLADDQVTMMFLGEKLRLALVTTHLAIRDVPAALTWQRVSRACKHLAAALRALAHPTPSIVVCGLNPHAGEGGLFGHEDVNVIDPGIEAARDALDSLASFEGPMPAESALRYAAAGKFDGAVAMYHDQATIASKLLDWQTAVNVTWGLPIVRTSVDHGVAYDAAARGAGDAEGMLAAVKMATRLAGAP